MAISAEPQPAQANGKGHPSDVGPVLGNDAHDSQPEPPLLKLRQRQRQMMESLEPAMVWARSMVQGPLVGLRGEFGRILLIMGSMLVVGAHIIWLLERSTADNAQFAWDYPTGIGDALWYVLVTIATVGYGDKVPVTLPGRVVGGMLILAGVLLVSLFTATASSLLVARRIKEGDSLDAETLDGHTIVCGWNHNVPRFLAALSQAGERVVVLVNEASNDVIEPHLKAYANLHILFIRGSYTQESILVSAGVKQAAHAVIVPDESLGQSEENDEQKTVLASLIVKEMNPQIRVYAHVLKREDAAHVKRAKADEVIVSDEFTGELLANHVAHPGAPQALTELMSFETTHALKAVEVPESFVGSTVGPFAQHLRDSANMVLLGFAVREEGFGLTQAMRGGSDYITEFIQQQVQAAGISMSTDERIVVRLNPPQDYVIGGKHTALVIT
ncbi:MAG TPA: potassium channel family protein [Chloroflexota bacterium]|nr:potassium channel family protein [Chloroflexota bacterium]